MKRLVKQTILATRELDALKRLESQLKSKGVNCRLNRRAHCVDVLDDDNFIIEQRYVKKSGKVPSTRNRYQYVGLGNGDYIKLVRDVQETEFTENDPYIKFVRSTNDPEDTRI